MKNKMAVNPTKQTPSEAPWNKSFTLNQHLLQPFSIEVLPKQNFDCVNLQRLLPANTKVFIPHLPNTTLKEIIDTVQNLKLAGFEPIPHIAARRISNAFELDALLTGLYDLKVQELLLIAGSRDEPLGEYQQCIDLLNSKIFNQFHFKRLLFAGHPDGHPVVERRKIEAALLKKIQLANKRGYESAIVTQFCFNIRAIYQWLQRIRKAGIHESVYIGITGPTKFKTLLHYAAFCGVSASAGQFMK
jgi:methylenetetrahydrofolate reductase (NADPH)